MDGQVTSEEEYRALLIAAASNQRPTIADTRTGTDWCPTCNAEVSTDRFWSQGSARDQCGICSTYLETKVLPVQQYFSYTHLGEPMRSVSKLCVELCGEMIAHLPPNEQRDLGLQKLLEAKDCFVRSSLDLPDHGRDGDQ
jgi:hypothetical protein